MQDYLVSIRCRSRVVGMIQIGLGNIRQGVGPAGADWRFIIRVIGGLDCHLECLDDQLPLLRRHLRFHDQTAAIIVVIAHRPRLVNLIGNTRVIQFLCSSILRDQSLDVVRSAVLRHHQQKLFVTWRRDPRHRNVDVCRQFGDLGTQFLAIG